MSVADLTGTSWTLNNSLTSYPGGTYSYTTYYVNITTAEALADAGGGYSDTFDSITIGYNSGTETNAIYLQLNNNYPTYIANGNDTKTLPDTWNDYYAGEFTITGGTDVTNADLISWLEANASAITPATPDVVISYNNIGIATMSESGTKTLETEGTFCTDDITVVYTKPSAPTPTLQEKTNIAPTTSSQTITADAGYDGLSSVQINAMPTGTVGTPSATKGTVSNHAVSVTPSVTNTTGYITGGTKTGTAVSVSASELVDGTLSVTTNGTKDVTNYANIAVNVSGGATIEPLSVTNNGTYTPPSGVDGYSPIVVNVSNSGSLPKRQVNFIDYDGTIVASYTASEWASVTALPSNPSHAGLISQGWNWTKAQIDAHLSVMPDSDIWVGQMYITESGKTEIDIELQDGRLEPYLGVGVNGTIIIDWGDGSSSSTVTGNSVNSQTRTSHTYSAAGHYTITISVRSGTFSFIGTSTYFLLSKGVSTASGNIVYANCVQAIRVGNGMAHFGNYAFYQCRSLKSITIPSSITAIGTYAFYYCYSLAAITIPSGVTSIGTYDFYYCTSLRWVAIPSSITTIETYAFYYCYSLAAITIPSGVTSIPNNAFYNCYSLASISIPNIVTSIGTYAFGYCCLSSLTIPSNVTSISSSAFQNCYGIAEYHLLPTTPPTLASTNAFSGIQTDCKIYVPLGSLSAYQTANNWSTYSSYMVGE